MSTLISPTKIFQCSPIEELANSISHGIGAMLSVAGLTLLVVLAALQGDITKIVSFSIYGATLVLLFLASTLYHATINARLKAIFKLFDHCAIYLLIAGTYTPLMLISLSGKLGYSLLCFIWLFAFAGIVFKIKFGNKYKVISLITYIAMGFISLLVIKQLYLALSTGGLLLLAIGGLIYTLGTIFYVKKTIPYNHAIWHIFVLLGAGCHFAMMLVYI